MRGPRKMWVDIPAERRVDEAMLRTCLNASREDGAAWVQRHLHHIQHPRCPVATRWGGGGTGKYGPCGVAPAPGEVFCPHHGGGKAPDSPEMRELRRLHAAHARLEAKAREIAIELAGVERLMARLDAQP